MLRFDQPQAGALAFYSASATSNSEANYVIACLLWDAITRGQTRVLSAAVNAVAGGYLAAQMDPYWLFTYNLLGDSLAQLHPTGPSRILAGGLSVQQSVFQALAVVGRGDDSLQELPLQLLYGGAPTGVFLNDRGIDGDLIAGDNVYTFQTALPAMSLPPTLLEVGGTDLFGRQLAPWPRLDVRAQ
jgi:hypothetical protein